ncbi:MAG: FkbM family methyltransferase [Brevundimonas sp.]|nr:MAG: FkbM family methyltransferase [Brevundimonas sp.]
MSLAPKIERTIRSLRDRVLDGLLSSRALRKAAYRRLSVNDNLVYRRFDDHDLVVDPGDLVGKTVLETGDFERRRTNMICRRAACLSDGRTVLEIGANIGTQTLYFIRSGLFDSVISLEPDPRNLELLRLNLRINGLGDRVAVVPAAAGAVAGQLTLRRDAGNSGGATLRAERLPHAVESEVTVPVVTIDGLVEQGDLDPAAIGLIWMDAEGFEDEILSACTQLLSRRTPMAFEFTPGFYDDATRLRILRTVYANYGHVSIIEDQGFEPLAEADAMVLMRRVDLFCC